MSRIPEVAELADDVSEIKSDLRKLVEELRADIRELSQKLERSYVPRELYEARHSALRSEVVGEIARLKTDMADKASVERVNKVSGKADTSYRLAWGVFALLSGLFVTALVGVLTTGIGP